MQDADRSTRIWVTVAALFEYFSIANTRFCVDELLLRGKNSQHDNYGFKCDDWPCLTQLTKHQTRSWVTVAGYSNIYSRPILVVLLRRASKKESELMFSSTLYKFCLDLFVESGGRVRDVLLGLVGL
ncbi:MAG: hypothetical protein GY820_21300 [Gammaproteobacteria bacterium]|nr:hypothetical protein [Gammaproteobacteria bacterium]